MTTLKLELTLYAWVFSKRHPRLVPKRLRAYLNRQMDPHACLSNNI